MEYVYRVLALLLPTNTVDKAVSQLTKAAAALEAAEAAQNARANKLDAKAAKLTTASTFAKSEAERAARIAGRISDLTA